MTDSVSVEEQTARALAFLNPVAASPASFDDQWYMEEAIQVLQALPPTASSTVAKQLIAHVFSGSGRRTGNLVVGIQGSEPASTRRPST